MKQELIRRLINVTLRGLSMASRFILIFAAAKLLTPAEVGLFGLMLATVSLSVLIIGADYYTYAQRELLARPPELWSYVIQHQAKAQGMLYIFLVPAQAFIFIGGWMDWRYAIWFFVLLIFEHIAQELNRLLVAMHKQLIASWVLFVRMGSWVLVIIPLMYYYPGLRSLESLYFAWLIGVVLAIVIGLFAVAKAVPIWKSYPFDKKWIKQGFKVGGLFLIATICFKGLLTFDRFAVEAFSNLEVLGVYVLYIGIVMGLYNFLDPAVFSFLYPRMLQHYQAGNMQAYNKSFRELIWSTFIISVILAVFIWFSMPVIINWLDKAIYSSEIQVLSMLIAAGFLYAIGMIPHYALYAMKRDRWIVTAHISALIIFFLSLVLISVESAIETVAIALLSAFGWMLLIKLIGLNVTRLKMSLKV